MRTMTWSEAVTHESSTVNGSVVSAAVWAKLRWENVAGQGGQEACLNVPAADGEVWRVRPRLEVGAEVRRRQCDDIRSALECPEF